MTAVFVERKRIAITGLQFESAVEIGDRLVQFVLDQHGLAVQPEGPGVRAILGQVNVNRQQRAVRLPARQQRGRAPDDGAGIAGIGL
jgi:hypothetical protein